MTQLIRLFDGDALTTDLKFRNTMTSYLKGAAGVIPPSKLGTYLSSVAGNSAVDTLKIRQAVTPAEQSILVLKGAINFFGHVFYISSSETITLAAHDATNSRVDVIVARITLSTSPITAEITSITGTPAASPVAPSISRTSSTYDIVLGYVNVPTAGNVITVDMCKQSREYCSEIRRISIPLGSKNSIQAGKWAALGIRFANSIEICKMSLAADVSGDLLVTLRSSVLANFPIPSSTYDVGSIELSSEQSKVLDRDIDEYNDSGDSILAMYTSGNTVPFIDSGELLGVYIESVDTISQASLDIWYYDLG